MNHMELESLIAQTLSTLTKGELSSATISAYKRYGFEVIRRHFKEREVKTYCESMLDELIIQKRISYKN